MAMQIVDGTGGGYSAAVGSDHRLKTTAVAQAKIYHISEDDGQAFSWTSTNYDYDALDTILLIKNTGSNVLHVHKAAFYSDTATQVIIHRPVADVVTPAGTATAGVNLNGNSNLAAEATAITDETTNVQGDILISFWLPAGQPVTLEYDDAVLFGTNQSFAVDYVTAGAACIVNVIGFFEAE